MCEGHCHKMQDIVRAQEGVNHGTVRDLIGRTQQLVTLMTKDEDALKKLDDDELDLLKAALDFLTEVRSSTRDWRRRPTTHRLPTPCFARPSRLQCVQGPNEENQNRLAGSTTITSCKEIISYVATCSCDSLKKKVARLKSSSVGLLVSLLEGRPDFLVHETMEEHIDVSLLRRRILQIYEDNVEEPEEPGAALGSLAKLYPFGMMSGALAKPVTCAPCELEEIRNIFSLIEIVGAHAPSFKKEALPCILDKPLAFAFHSRAERAQHATALARHEHMKKYAEAHGHFQSQLVSVEISWNGTLQQTFFLKPQIVMEYRQFVDAEKARLVRRMQVLLLAIDCCLFFPLITHSLLLYLFPLVRWIQFTSDDRIVNLFRSTEDFFRRLQHVKWMSDQTRLYDVVADYESQLRDAMFALSLLLNYVLVVSTSHALAAEGDAGGTPKTYDVVNDQLEYKDGTPAAMAVLGSLHAALSLTVLSLALLLHLPFRGSPWRDAARERYGIRARSGGEVEDAVAAAAAASRVSRFLGALRGLAVLWRGFFWPALVSLTAAVVCRQVMGTVPTFFWIGVGVYACLCCFRLVKDWLRSTNQVLLSLLATDCAFSFFYLSLLAAYSSSCGARLLPGLRAVVPVPVRGAHGRRRGRWLVPVSVLLLTARAGDVAVLLDAGAVRDRAALGHAAERGAGRHAVLRAAGHVEPARRVHRAHVLRLRLLLHADAPRRAGRARRLHDAGRMLLLSILPRGDPRQPHPADELRRRRLRARELLLCRASLLHPHRDAARQHDLWRHHRPLRRAARR
jgi:hypothetical protein